MRRLPDALRVRVRQPTLQRGQEEGPFRRLRGLDASHPGSACKRGDGRGLQHLGRIATISNLSRADGLTAFTTLAALAALATLATLAVLAVLAAFGALAALAAFATLASRSRATHATGAAFIRNGDGCSLWL